MNFLLWTLTQSSIPIKGYLQTYYMAGFRSACASWFKDKNCLCLLMNGVYKIDYPTIEQAQDHGGTYSTTLYP